jgi:hypothetical protein
MILSACCSVFCSSGPRHLPQNPGVPANPPAHANCKREEGASGVASVKKRSRAEVVLLGALPGAQKKQINYSLDKIENIFLRLCPDIVLMEIPMNWLNSRGEPSSELRSYLESENQSETTVAWNYCEHNKLKCVPYDINDRSDFYRDPAKQKCESLITKAFEVIDSQASEKWGGLQQAKINFLHCAQTTPKVVNSSVCDEIKKRWDALSTPFIEDYVNKHHPELNDCSKQIMEFEDRRNRVMAENICHHAKANPNARILVTVGFEHRPYLKQHLTESCPDIDLREYWKVLEQAQEAQNPPR